MQVTLGAATALVSGAGSGIGAAIAGALAREGCRVYVTDLLPEGAQQVAAAARADGGDAVAVTLDVADRASVQAMTDRVIAERGGVDVLVNSAGVLTTGSVRESSLTDWQRVVDVNLSGVFHCSQAVLPLMIDRGYGRIVNIASVSGMRGGGALGNTLYGTTKAGVIAMTKGLARESAAAGVTVNAIAPGLVDSPLVGDHLGPDALSGIPAGRVGEPSEIASLAVFLASDACRYLTGATVVVDGGFLTA